MNRHDFAFMRKLSAGVAGSMSIRVERYDAISSRLFDGDSLIGFALQLANGRWGLFDLAGRRVEKQSFDSPRAVAKSCDVR
jgi:hypothetical protein